MRNYDKLVEAIMQRDKAEGRPNRREFLRAGLSLGTVAAVPGLISCVAQPTAQAASPTAAQSPSPTQPGRLTMHAIDIFSGTPGAGMRIDLSVLEGGRYRLIKTFNTNKGGRTDDPILIGDAMVTGRYELLLYVEEYFSRLGTKLPSPPFLDKVPLRFAIYDAAQRYHVPVLLTPWSYSYYRGS